MNDSSFSNPASVLEHVLIRPGSTVVDIGAGSGVYSLLASERVGDEGQVYAIEVQLSLVDILKKSAVHNGLDNLHVVWGDAELPQGTKLADSSADLVLLTNVLFTIEDKPGLVEEVERIMKNDAKLLVVDWQAAFDGIGPSPDRIVPEKFARDLFTSAGFVLEKTIPAGVHHYGMIFNKK